MREKVLNIIGNNLETVIKEDLKNIVTNKKMEKEFLECGDFIGTYENSFDNALLETFSRENLQVIYRKLKGVNGYEYIEKLKLSLEKLCEEYQVESRDYFIEQFINMFKDCIYRNDRTLAQEIFSADFRVDMNQNFAIAREGIDLLNSKVDLLFVSMNKDSYNNAQIPLPDNREMLNNEEQNLLEWKLIHPKRDDSKDNIKERVKYLTVLWKKERQAVPGWYVIPKNKRKELELYTREYEYIYNEDILSFRELFEFAHEVIWRFEMGFMKYSMKMQNRIHEIWMCASEKNDFLNNTEVKGKYFFIGQVLLRMYRENMMDELWHLIYEKLEKCSGYIDTGRDELYLEKIKYSFMKMNISEVCILLNDRSRINEKSYSVRMQIVGLKAECGMLDDAVKELNFLESALETEIEKEKKNSKQKEGMVYYSSILACSYFLHRFIYQAINLQTRDETFNKLTNKVMLYQQYFDYEKERDEFYKDLFREQKKMRKKTPFELGRINRIICQGGRVPGSGYQFYRMLDRTAIPLHMRWVRLLDADESDFILNLIDDHPYIGWYMLLRLGESDTTKATLTRRECIEIIRKDEMVLDALCIKPLYHNGWYLQYQMLWYVVFYIVMRISNYFTLNLKKRMMFFGLVSIVFFFSLNEIRAEQSLSFFIGILISEFYDDIKRIVNLIVGISLLCCGMAFLVLKQLSVIRSAPQLIYNLVQLFIKCPFALGLIIISYILLSKKITLKYFAWMGSVSYELYLLHGYILPYMEGLGGAIVFWIASIGIATCYHIILEKGKVIWEPVMRF